MNIEQALLLSCALQKAALKALQDGCSNVDLTSELEEADDAAREELEKAIEAAKYRLAD